MKEKIDLKEVKKLKERFGDNQERIDEKMKLSRFYLPKGASFDDVYSQREVEIHPNMTGGELHDALSKVGAELLIETLDKLDDITPLKQDEAKVVYAQKIDKSECKIDFNESGEIIL